MIPIHPHICLENSGYALDRLLRVPSLYSAYPLESGFFIKSTIVHSCLALNRIKPMCKDRPKIPFDV